MARRRFTHRRPLLPDAGSEAVIRYYRTYRNCYGDTLAEFVAHYGRLWDEAHEHGVKGYDGIMRLIELFPERGRAWLTATAREYVRPRPRSFELEGDMLGFLGTVSAACFRHRNGPPPDPPAAERDGAMRLPPWALLRPRDGEFEEGQSSRAPTRKRVRVESFSYSSEETVPTESDTSANEDHEEDPDEEQEEDPEADPEESMRGGDDPDEEELEIGSLADLGIELVPPPPVGPPPGDTPTSVGASPRGATAVSPPSGPSFLPRVVSLCCSCGQGHRLEAPHPGGTIGSSRATRARSVCGVPRGADVPDRGSPPGD